MGRRQSVGDISYGLVIGALALLAVTIIVAPVVIVLLTSFTNGQAIKFPPQGLSLRWYEQLFGPAQRQPMRRELDRLAVGERRQQYDDDGRHDDRDGEQRQRADHQPVGDVADTLPPTH